MHRLIPYWKKIFSVIIFFFILIVIQIRNPEINGPFKGIIGNILNPFVYYSVKTSNFFSDIFDNYIDLVNVKQENKQLKSQIDNLKLNNQILKEKLTDFNNLKKQLDFKEAYQFNSIACNVIGRNMDSYARYIIIDRGSKDGIKKNQSVISFQGLIGKVTDVQNGYSKIMLTLDVSSRVSVMNFRTRTVGILTGDGKNGLIVDYYDKLDNAKTGDLITTSGLGGLFPKGIPVGKIYKISKEESNVFQKIYVAPTVDFYKIENVLVVTSIP